MKKSNRRNRLLFLNLAFVLGLVFYAVQKVPKKDQQKRTVANIEQAESLEALDSVNLAWKKTTKGLEMKISGREEDICKEWTTAQVTFRAEGIAYSGEVDRIVQTVSCANGEFKKTLGTNMAKAQGSDVQKIGVFAEEPPMWVMEKIEFQDQTQSKVIQSQDVQDAYGSLPTMPTK